MSEKKKKVKKKNPKYKKRRSLKKQVSDRLESLNRIGESRHEAKEDYRNNVSGGKFSMNRTVGIHSKETMKTYKNALNKFVDYLREEFPEVKDLEQIKKEHCVSYIKYRANTGKAATTYSKDISALNKCFRYDLNKKEIGVEAKKFENYTNNRVLKEHHNRINLKNYKNEVLMGWATGMRKESYNAITKSRFRKADDGLYKDVWLKEKGGKPRYAEILKEHRQAVTEFLDSLQIEDNELIFPKKISKLFPSHRLRQIYAQDLYEQTVNEICEKNYVKGYLGFDKNAVLKVSKNLGHNREEVLKNYLKVERSLNPKVIIDK